MKRMGRPPSEFTKHKSLTVRLSDEMHEQLVKYASEHNLTMTDVALRALEKELSGTGDK